MPKSLDQVEVTDTQGSKCKLEAERSSHRNDEQLLKEQQAQPDSGDSSKTQSDPSPTEQPDVEEMSSEGTLSDHPVSDNEP